MIYVQFLVSRAASGRTGKTKKGITMVKENINYQENVNEPGHENGNPSVFQCSPITKTCLYSFDPLRPHFYIVKLGFIGVYINFSYSAQKHRLWVLVRTTSVRRF